MKTVALAIAVLLAGCAATNTRTDSSEARLTQLKEKSRTIVDREKQCIDQTLARSRDEIAGIAATPSASVELQIQKENRERDRKMSECRARADEENAEIYAQERDEYKRQAQQERARAALMMTLTTSQPR